MRKELICLFRVPENLKHEKDIEDSDFVNWMVQQKEIKNLIYSLAIKSGLIEIDSNNTIKRKFESIEEMKSHVEKTKNNNSQMRKQEIRNQKANEINAKINNNFKLDNEKTISLSDAALKFCMTMQTVKNQISWSSEFETETIGRRTVIKRKTTNCNTMTTNEWAEKYKTINPESSINQIDKLTEAFNSINKANNLKLVPARDFFEKVWVECFEHIDKAKAKENAKLINTKTYMAMDFWKAQEAFKYNKATDSIVSTCTNQSTNEANYNDIGGF